MLLPVQIREHLYIDILFILVQLDYFSDPLGYLYSY